MASSRFAAVLVPVLVAFGGCGGGDADTGADPAAGSPAAGDPGGAPAPPEPGAAPASGDPGASPVSRSGIALTFLLDPRITRGVYLGDLWVSPPTFTQVQDGTALLAIRARADVVGGGPGAETTTAWSSADPEVATVSPARGREVEIAVRQLGATTITVSAGSASRSVDLRSVDAGGGLLRVDISQ